MIHILNYEENIIDALSFKQDAVYEAEHILNVQETMETFDFSVKSSVAKNIRDRNRVIIEDNMGNHREFIIENIVDLETHVTEIRTNASYLEDIKKGAKPLKPHEMKNVLPTVAMDYILADTGWEVAPETETPKSANVSWDKITDRLTLLKELQDIYDMRLLFYIVTDGNKVVNRYVSLKQVNPMFNGTEINYDDNLIGLKREIDYSDIVTALIGVGPEDSETKERIYVEVTDDDAQQQFGLPYRYNWDYVEVNEENDIKATKAYIEAETRKELNDRKKAVLTYDITSTDINANVGDMIRVKDEQFMPEIYLEAEIIEMKYNLINKVKEYKFGILREFTRAEVYSQYEKFRDELQKRLQEVLSNTGNIISERLEEELKHVERYIEKSPVPPLAPKEGDLWLDTSHGSVAVLKRYENGKWVKSSVTDVKEIGGVTREQTIYETLKERKNRLDISYSNLYNKHDALVTQNYYHYVELDLQEALSKRMSDVVSRHNSFVSAFNAINSEQPTIGLLTTAISRAMELEQAIVEYERQYELTRADFDSYMRILQSQYTEEKFKEAMEKVADSIGGTFDGTNIIADIPNQEDLNQLNKDIKDYLTGQIDTLDDKLGKKVASDIKTARDELSASIGSVDKKVDGIQVGGRNLLLNSRNITLNGGDGNTNIIRFINSENLIRIEAIGNKVITQNFYNTVFANSWVNKEEIFSNIQSGKPYTLSMEVRYSGNSQVHLGFDTRGVNSAEYARTKKVSDTNGKWVKLSATKVEKDRKVNTQSLLIGWFDSVEIGDYLEIRNLKLEKGTVATDWTPAPEDMENKVSNITQTVTKHDTSIGLLENEISLKANSSDVTQQLDNVFKPLQTTVNANKAELQVQAGLINQKVNSTQYTADMNNVTRELQTATSERKQLAESISQTVSVDEYSKGTENLLRNTDFTDKKNVDRLEKSASGVVTISQSKPPDYDKTFALSQANPLVVGNNIGFQTKSDRINIEQGQNYTLSIVYIVPSLVDENLTYTYLMNSLPNAEKPNQKLAITTKVKIGTAFTSFNVFRATFTFTANWSDENAWLLIASNVKNDGNAWLRVSEPKLERGSIATPYSKSPQDTEEVLTRYNTEINQAKDAISQKVSYEEINKTNKTLERIVSELIVDTRGITYQYDVNGLMSGFTLNKNYFKLNHNLIDINNGDVLIQNGTTTIKQAVINNGHIKELSFDKLSGGTAKFGGSGRNGTFEILDTEDNAIMVADYEQASVSEISIDTAKIETVISNSIVTVTGGPRKYIVNREKYNHLESAVQSDNANPNLIRNGKSLTFSGGTTESLTHTFNSFNIIEPLVAGETYTISFDVVSVTGQNSGFLDVRPYEPDSGSTTIDIRSGRGEATFTPTVNSTRLYIYRDIVGQSRYDTTVSLENVKLEKGDVATPWVEVGDLDEEGTSVSENEELWFANSIQQAVDSVPKYLNGIVVISVETETDDDQVDIVGFTGYGGMRIEYTINRNDNTFWIESCASRIWIQGNINGTAKHTKLYGNNKGGIIECYSSTFVFARAIYAYGDRNVQSAFKAYHGTSLCLRDCNFYNVDYGLYGMENSNITYFGGEGNAEIYGWYMRRGCMMFGSGKTRPLGKTAVAYKIEGARDFTEYTVEKPTPPVNPPKITKPKAITKKWTTSSARHFYRNQPNKNWTVTFMRDFPMQGTWNDGWGPRDGAWFFGTGMKNTLKGKKIKKVRVSIGRSASNNQGYTGQRKFTLRLHNTASKPASNNNTSPTYSSQNYTGTLSIGQRKWFDVTSAFASQLSTGNWSGFGVRTTSNSVYEYMALAKSITVEVTYE